LIKGFSHTHFEGTAMISAILLSCAIVVGSSAQTGAPPDRSDLETYKAAASQAGRDPDAHVKLALWCEAHGLSAERTRQLALAVLRDPSHALARGLLGMVAHEGKWQRPEQVSRSTREDRDREARLGEYLKRRAKTPDRAEDQWKLALWCEQNDLKQEATAHVYRVLMLDPSREAAWKRLGFKKSGGHWSKPEQIAASKAEVQAQHKASAHWKAAFEKWADALSHKDKARRAEAEKGLAEVTDPRAVPMIWVIFAQSSAERQRIAVRLLGQIDSPGASRALALLAVMSPNAAVRGDATASLRRRDPREFGPLLIGMFRQPVKYQVQAVGGPGSPGVLAIEKPDAKVNRAYSPPPAPTVRFMPGDVITSDDYGLPVLVHTSTGFQFGGDVPGNSIAAATAMFGGVDNAPQSNPLSHLGLSPALTDKLTAATQPHPLPIVGDVRPGNGIMWAGLFAIQETRIPIGQMMLEAQQVALAAQQQLARDAQTLDAYNARVADMNGFVREVLVAAIGTDLGPEKTAWEKWMVDLFGYSYVAPPEVEKPSYYEDVPLEYQAQPDPIMVSQPVPLAIVVERRHSCFGAGTLVQTFEGPRLIEKLRFGDQVLTQNSKTGELKYQPLIAVYHNPPNATLRIELETETIVATGIHRLWKTRRGWVMARELKPGDALRSLGGLSVVKSVEQERVQPVYNLRVADGESFFVGKAGILAHDNSVVNPTPSPFDAPSDIAKLTSSRD
jgi:Pretoxin HINT domain